MHAARTQLSSTKTVLVGYRSYLTNMQTELTHTSSRWATLKGNAGELQNAIAQVEDEVLGTYIPTRRMMSDHVLRAINKGVMFLEFEGVEPELRKALGLIDGAMEGSGKLESDKIKEMTQKIRSKVDETVRVDIPAHKADLQWFPKVADLGDGDKEEDYLRLAVEKEEEEEEEDM